jgi:hypothetical protein
MDVYGRAVRGLQAGAVAGGGVAFSFFVLDLIRIQPLAAPGALSGAVFGPTGFQLDLTSLSGLIAGLSTVYQLAAFTSLHFVAFALVGVLASFLFDWKAPGGLKRLLVMAALCTAVFLGTGVVSSSVVALEGVGMTSVVTVNFLAALLMAGYLHLANMPEPEETPPH